MVSLEFKASVSILFDHSSHNKNIKEYVNKAVFFLPWVVNLSISLNFLLWDQNNLSVLGFLENNDWFYNSYKHKNGYYFQNNLIKNITF